MEEGLGRISGQGLFIERPGCVGCKCAGSCCVIPAVASALLVDKDTLGASPFISGKLILLPRGVNLAL